MLLRMWGILEPYSLVDDFGCTILFSQIILQIVNNILPMYDVLERVGFLRPTYCACLSTL